MEELRLDCLKLASGRLNNEEEAADVVAYAQVLLAFVKNEAPPTSATLKFYDAGTDEVRPATQADIDRLGSMAYAYGQVRSEVRKAHADYVARCEKSGLNAETNPI